ncbi:hypothetical protein GJV85_07340 [Sulfurimonas aquatica]|uniref:DUF403 domain-containing protein n=1 Tax=Sulfurimonas aquatica TaxID=2672570 RepID=A0A975B0E5_9BACT|nr:circularly permuted type 2 ATP-grasp protein [Sulfurimonas aquatica]QSZ41926.1 hypothetical protein GJV85_07340 [Sulfurimonas aquatica]
MSIFEGYSRESSLDEVFDSEGNVKESWSEVVKGIEESGLELLKEKQDEIDWHLEDNGVAYNVFDSNEKPTSRSWSLDPIPFVVKEEEWSEIKKGLKQRAKLFNLILKDLYSEQKLIKENIVPAEVIFAHKGFLTEVFNFGKKEDFNLYFYATDIARGPDGKMWVVSDKAQAPSGLGYAIENRLTMNSVANELYPNISTKKLYSFIQDYKALLRELTGGDTSTAALLTPGAYNETYFEQAYLSSYLEINMVQGADLLAKDGFIWAKSLGGLKKINTLLRRVDDRFCDPLELKSESQLGVAGLLDAMRNNNLNMINPIGSAILENIGLNPFMKKISQFFLKEDLILPQIATWWCGQKKELDFVIKNLDTLIVKKIDRTEEIQIYFGKNLSVEQKEQLISKLIQNPHQYVAQEEIGFSTVPYFNKNKIEPRNAVIRAFSIKKGDDYTVMNGGLVRIAAHKDSLLVSSKNSGISKDLWILGEEEEENIPMAPIKYVPFVETSIENISTQKAENLFWLGRYLSRSIATTRLILHVIKKITNFYRYEIVTSKESQVILQNALTHMTMTYPGFFDLENKENLEIFPMVEISSVIKDINRSGSLSMTISMLSNANINLKDLLTLESWKLFDKANKEWYAFANRKNDSTLVIAGELDKFLIYQMAYKQLVYESIFKEQGLILFEIGFKIEDALLLISKAKSILCIKVDKSISSDVLTGMLNSVEGFNAYRAHYKSSLTLENVLDFLILNPQFPKSLSYIMQALLDDFKLLPKAKESLTSYENTIIKVQKILNTINLQALINIKEEDGVYTELDDILSELSDLTLKCSDEFSNTYFSHNDE